jgi:hypothetical protein
LRTILFLGKFENYIVGTNSELQPNLIK